ncbi:MULTISPECIES: RnfH family protein [Luteimonas]|uniref:RnfH family protein n=1 Tax=Luteimonas TaxID=83614 RepID=UPI000C7B112B|nr:MULTISPECIES: RnfH family protein [Luteimonas]
MRVDVVLAWPDRSICEPLTLADGATVAEALAAWRARGGPLDDAGVVGYAVFGIRATATTVLGDGDRLELLRGLQVDPKDARRRRALKRDAP